MAEHVLRSVAPRQNTESLKTSPSVPNEDVARIERMEGASLVSLARGWFSASILTVFAEWERSPPSLDRRDRKYVVAR